MPLTKRQKEILDYIESFIDDRAKDEAVAEALWDQTEQMVGPFFA